MTSLTINSNSGLQYIVKKTLITGLPTSLNVDLSAYALKQIKLRCLLRANTGLSGANVWALKPFNAANMNCSYNSSRATGTAPPARAELLNGLFTTINTIGVAGTDASANDGTFIEADFYNCQDTLTKPFSIRWSMTQGGLAASESGFIEGHDRSANINDGITLTLGGVAFNAISWYEILGMR